MKIVSKHKKIPKPTFDFKPVEEVLDRNAEEMKTNTVESAPEDTGNLKESILKKEIANGRAVYLDADKAHYGFFQEYGWQAPTRFVPGKFFFKSAYDQQEVQLEEDMKAVMDKIVKIK